MLDTLNNIKVEKQCENDVVFRLIVNSNSIVYACSKHTLYLAEYAIAKRLLLHIDPIPYNDKEPKHCFIRVYG